MRVLSLVLFLLIGGIFQVKAQKLEVLVKDIRSSNGAIVVGIYTNQESFAEEEVFLEKKIKKSSLSNGQLKFEISLPPGTYGLALLDDEDDDDEMNYNFFGIPEEGFGFSDYYHTGLSRPKFDSFEFTVNENNTTMVTVKMKYM